MQNWNAYKLLQSNVKDLTHSMEICILKSYILRRHCNKSYLNLLSGFLILYCHCNHVHKNGTRLLIISTMFILQQLKNSCYFLLKLCNNLRNYEMDGKIMELLVIMDEGQPSIENIQLPLAPLLEWCKNRIFIILEKKYIWCHLNMISYKKA